MTFITSEHATIPSQDHPFALRVPTFGLDEIVEPDLGHVLVDEMKQVQCYLRSAASADSIPLAPSFPRKGRPIGEQYANPPPSGPSSPMHWQKDGDWYCAVGVQTSQSGSESEVTSDGPGGSPIWSGARHYLPVHPGQWATARLKILSDITSRMGWGSEDSREVGTDERSYGYGSFGKKSHKGIFHPFGTVFGSGDCVTGILDRRGAISSMTFQVNKGPMLSAFEIPNMEAPFPLFFAVCGRPGFKVWLLSCTVCQ